MSDILYYAAVTLAIVGGTGMTVISGAVLWAIWRVAARLRGRL